MRGRPGQAAQKRVRWQAPWRRAGRPVPAARPVRLLVAGVILLPASILGLLAWQAWQQSWREAATEVSRSAEAAAEYALRLLEGHKLRAQRANDMLRGLSDGTIRAEQALLSAQLSTLVAEAGGEAVLNIFVFDARGYPMVSATVPSVPTGQSFADRAFNRMLRAPDAPSAAVSGPYRGRIDAADYFAITLRREGGGNDVAPGAYQGVINISARTQETAGRLRRLLKSPADSLALLLADGGVLVATGAEAVEGGALPAELPPQAVREALRRATPAAPPPRLFRDAEGLAVLQPVPGWDAYAFAARPREQVVARWRGSVGRLLLLGGPAMLALLGLALLVGRGQRRLVEANAGLERRVAERTAALAASEERLRLAQEAAGIGVWELALGAHGRPARPPADRTIWSDQQFRLLGLPPGGPPPGLRALLRRVLPADRMMVLAALRRPPPQPVLRVRLRRFGDGALRWLFLTGQRVAGEGGRPARLIGVATDITERQQSGEALREAEARYRALFDAAPFAVFLFDPATHAILDVNERACRDYGYSAEEFRSLRIGDIDALEQADAIRARGRRHRIGPDVQEFEARHRLRDGALRDVMVRVQGVRLSGRDLSYAAHMDITARKHAEEQRLLLAREVDHRAKNVLALVQAALRLTPKEDAAAYTAAVEGRVMALARAHTLLAQGYWTGAELRDLLEGELAAFLAPAEGAEPGAPRVLLEGPPVTLPPALAQGVSMVLHELATNATKHGALSREGGTVRVAWSVSEEPARLRLRWTERGGPPLFGAPGRAGFGSRMLEATIGRQLGGAVRRDWRPEGLECELELPLPAPQHRDAA